ncbi:hypothetical protein OHA40_30935 [Nocardia sp. NBC_00508]|nr:hypothetical protein [Nocardia sp. NBC_00508]WUD65946.1 hypothetical protein OHA40_30935 [Nocardia sp. NBC_00508]
MTTLYPATTRPNIAGVWSYTILLDSTLALAVGSESHCRKG